MLQNPEHVAWAPLLAIESKPLQRDEWTEQLLRYAVVTSLTMIGFLYLRILNPLSEWPWRVGKLVCDQVPEDAKASIRDAIVGARPCCVPPGYVRNLRANFDTPEALQTPAALAHIYDCFVSTPSNNIPSEYRFARMRCHRQSSNGKRIDSATVASNHVLGEVASQHGVSVRRCRCAVSLHHTVKPRCCAFWSQIELLAPLVTHLSPHPDDSDENKGFGSHRASHWRGMEAWMLEGLGHDNIAY